MGAKKKDRDVDVHVDAEVHTYTSLEKAIKKGVRPPLGGPYKNDNALKAMRKHRKPTTKKLKSGRPLEEEKHARPHPNIIPLLQPGMWQAFGRSEWTSACKSQNVLGIHASEI